MTGGIPSAVLLLLREQPLDIGRGGWTRREDKGSSREQECEAGSDADPGTAPKRDALSRLHACEGFAVKSRRGRLFRERTQALH